MEKRLATIRQEVAAMTGGLFGIIAVPFEENSELQRQVLAAFAFGMIFAAGKLKGRDSQSAPLKVHDPP
jgi:hypothetical protein